MKFNLVLFLQYIGGYPCAVDSHNLLCIYIQHPRVNHLLCQSYSLIKKKGILTWPLPSRWPVVNSLQNIIIGAWIYSSEISLSLESWDSLCIISLYSGRTPSQKSGSAGFIIHIWHSWPCSSAGCSPESWHLSAFLHWAIDNRQFPLAKLILSPSSFSNDKGLWWAQNSGDFQFSI